jgi:hypothetical protein
MPTMIPLPGPASVPGRRDHRPPTGLAVLAAGGLLAALNVQAGAAGLSVDTAVAEGNRVVVMGNAEPGATVRLVGRVRPCLQSGLGSHRRRPLGGLLWQLVRDRHLHRSVHYNSERPERPRLHR